jgi:hypothetical protein
LSTLNVSGCFMVTADGIKIVLQQCTAIKYLFVYGLEFEESDRLALRELYPHLMCF